MRLLNQTADRRRSTATARRHRYEILRARLRVRAKEIRKAHGSSDAFKPFLVKTWSGAGVGRALCTRPPTFAPSILCLTQNRDETLKLLNQLRLNAMRRPTRQQRRAQNRRGRLPELKGYVDLSKVEYIGTGAAVVFAAFYERERKISGRVPPTINLHEWSDAAVTTLYELGFFETVGHLLPRSERFRDIGEVRTMTMMTGRNGTELQAACEAILELSRFIDERGPLRLDVMLALNSALGEAMSNVAAHAYPESDESVPADLQLWWVSASADREKRLLRVVAYDQGATIPVTLPQRTWAQSFDPRKAVLALINKDVGPYLFDGDYIEFAMGEGRTQTGIVGRGQGLPQMRDLVNICGSGCLTILSRGGVCCYRPNQKTVTATLPFAIEGTLIEWEMQLPAAV